MKKKNTAILINVLIVIFEVIAIILTLKNNHNDMCLEYYTEDSNLLALAVSLVYIIYLIRNIKMPDWLLMIKYISNINLCLTFLVVIMVLIPTNNFDFKYYLFNGPFLFQHFLVPIISVISFLYFEKTKEFNKNDNLTALSFTITYSIILIILNILNIVNGPYPFLKIREQSVIKSICWFLSLTGLAYVIGYMLRMTYCKINKKIETKK